MNEKDQLGGLYAVAQEQQQAAGSAVEALQHQAKVVSVAVQGLSQATETLKAQPAVIAGTVNKAVRETVQTAISEALAVTSDKTTAKAQDAAERAAKGFLAVTKEASQAAQQAAEAASTAARDVNWMFLALAFSFGLAGGAGGLYLLHTPKAEVYLDTAKVAQEVAAVCRARR